MKTIFTNYDSMRYYFVYPGCGKRKSTLYDMNSVMACRTFAKLYYPLQENKVQRDNVSQFLYYDRLLSKARTELNPKFEWPFYSYLRYDPITLSLQNKPKGMHCSTYNNKIEQIDKLINKNLLLYSVINIDKQKHAAEINKQYDVILSKQKTYIS